MSLFSDLIASGKIRDRDTLRRVYRRLVKRLHPDSAPKSEVATVEAKPRTYVDFDNLKRDLAEAERLLLELGPGGDEGGTGAEARRSGATSEKPRPVPAQGKAHDRATPNRPLFNRGILIAELRDLVARGLPVNLRAASRNRAYRDCVSTVGA
ncbi:MAG: J domain-containing protein, partial [Spirochaetota bacterium]